MTHDPLCPWHGSTEFDLVIGCDDCDLITKARADERGNVISEVDKLASGVSFYNLLDERFFFESLHAMKTPACQISDTKL